MLNLAIFGHQIELEGTRYIEMLRLLDLPIGLWETKVVKMGKS